MVTRIQSKSRLEFFLCLSLLCQGIICSLAQAEIDPAKVLVQYSFDQGGVATGPDTYSVYNFSQGNVQLSTAFSLSGSNAVEITDVAGSGNFPELQGYFKELRQGTLFAHFAFLVTNPEQELNIALAGPACFRLKQDGIGFWLKSENGYLRQVSDSVPKKLFKLQRFTWYVVDLAYAIERGRYDLTILEEGSPLPLVQLKDQANASNNPHSVVDKFSFIGDLADRSNVDYYVDDVVVGTDQEIQQLPFVAPGRRRLFVDRFFEARSAQLQAATCFLPETLDDLGLSPDQRNLLLEARLTGGLLNLARLGEPPILGDEAPAAIKELVSVLGVWREGCGNLAQNRLQKVVEKLKLVSAYFPASPAVQLSYALALFRAGRSLEFNQLLEQISLRWSDDPRYWAFLAKLAIEKGDLGEAESLLRIPAEQLIGLPTDDPLRDLLAGEISTETQARLRIDRPEQAERILRQRLVLEQFFFALVWNSRYEEAESFALRLANEFEQLAISPAEWLGRAGDAAFMAGNYPDAKSLYLKSISSAKENASAAFSSLKLADAAFMLKDLETEQLYREHYYGKLE